MPPFLKKTLARSINSDYRLNFSGLKNGLHRFEFKFEKPFFEHFKEGLIPNGQLKGIIELNKQNTILTLQCSFDGKVEVTCDRCTGQYLYPVKGQSLLTVKFGDVAQELDEYWIIGRQEHFLELIQYWYDIIALALPLRIVPCELEASAYICDQEVIQKLNKFLIVDKP